MASALASVRTLDLRCFACDVPLAQVIREGVEIDCCPHCRSIWLDRGELFGKRVIHLLLGLIA